MVGDQHQIADVPQRVHPTTGVRDHEDLGTELAHHPDRERHLLKAIAFVAVKAALHGDDGEPRQLAEQQASAVALDGRDREVGDLLVRDDGFGLDFLRQGTETRTQDEGEPGLEAGTGPNRTRR